MAETGWITTNGVTATTGSGSGGRGGGDPTGGAGAGEGEGEIEVEVLVGGNAIVAAGSSYVGKGFFVVLRFTGEEEELLCEATWDATSMSAREDCTTCAFAFDVLQQNVLVDVDVDGSCAATGFAADDYEGVATSLGFAAPNLMTYDGSRWSVDANADAELSKSSFSFERGFAR